MIIDTHAHYDDEAFDADRDRVLKEVIESGVELVVNIGASMKTSQNTVDLCNQYEFIYGAVGVHPSDTEELTEASMNILKEYTKHPKVVAIGEIGLDYYWDEPERELQKKWFLRQLDLAKELKLPVIIHSRDAARDTLDILKSEEYRDVKGVIHCYSYGIEMAKEYLKLGYMFGIGGVVTFRNAKKLKEVVEFLPMESLVVETDCPYLAPVPHRGERNSSMNLTHVVKEIAQIKNCSEEEMIRVTNQNARRLYRLNLPK